MMNHLQALYLIIAAVIQQTAFCYRKNFNNLQNNCEVKHLKQKRAQCRYFSHKSRSLPGAETTKIKLHLEGEPIRWAQTASVITRSEESACEWFNDLEFANKK